MVERINQATNQHQQSFLEHQQAFNKTKEVIQTYTRASLRQTPNLCIVGGPGTGKTTQIQLGAVNAMLKGLNVAVMALMAVRAKKLGGEHIARMFGIRVYKDTPASRVSELAIINLFRSTQ